ncbi:hypothetical protein C8T65DRAFT_618675 [Cerioporus squamosus]|nr:hypothetical protein C8T65DRAFT_618675 [Cerioporus squamosus]
MTYHSPYVPLVWIRRAKAYSQSGHGIARSAECLRSSVSSPVASYHAPSSILRSITVARLVIHVHDSWLEGYSAANRLLDWDLIGIMRPIIGTRRPLVHWTGALARAALSPLTKLPESLLPSIYSRIARGSRLRMALDMRHTLYAHRFPLSCPWYIAQCAVDRAACPATSSGPCWSSYLAVYHVFSHVLRTGPVIATCCALFRSLFRVLPLFLSCLGARHLQGTLAAQSVAVSMVHFIRSFLLGSCDNSAYMHHFGPR